MIFRMIADRAWQNNTFLVSEGVISLAIYCDNDDNNINDHQLIDYLCDRHQQIGTTTNLTKHNCGSV